MGCVSLEHTARSVRPRDLCKAKVPNPRLSDKRKGDLTPVKSLRYVCAIYVCNMYVYVFHTYSISQLYLVTSFTQLCAIIILHYVEMLRTHSEISEQLLELRNHWRTSALCGAQRGPLLVETFKHTQCV